MEIQGFPNYLIYDDGRVWSKVGKGRFLRPAVLKNGYKMVSLFKNGKGTSTYIHRLLAEHYIPNPTNRPCVDHIDRNRGNNDLSNLRWATVKENSSNTGLRSDNPSGHIHIGYNNQRQRHVYQRIINGKPFAKHFDSKIDAICYKYIKNLRIKAGHPLRK